MYLIVRKNNIIAAAAFMLVAAVFAAGFIVPPNIAVTASSTLEWGLGFGKPGTQPRGNESPEQLHPYDAYFMGAPDKKVIYLTFDAGYENGHTPAILDTLKKHAAPAAFFVIGGFIKDNPDLVRQMADGGILFCNHTYHHPDMSKIADVDSFRNELESLEALYKETTGRDMAKYYRPPEGKYSRQNLQMAKDLGYKTIFWSLAYADWRTDAQPSAELAFERLVPRIHPGAVVLLHNVSSTNAAILDDLLTRWEDAGYSFGRLDELVA